MLELQNLCYQYTHGTDAVHDLSLTLRPGEKVAVLGNNGAGKSTFFLLCNGVLRPTSGKVLLDGEAVTYQGKSLTQLRRRVGLVFQNPDVQLIGGTVEQEISFGPMNLRLPKEEVKRRVDDAITRLGLEPLRHRPPQELSGGEKKRVSIADILAMEPELMLLDEPAAGLDPIHAAILEENLEMLRRSGIGLVVATHDVEFAWRWAERVLVFHAGTILRDDTPEAVFSDVELLKTAGLCQPTLLQIANQMGLAQMPRSIDALTDLLKKPF